MSGVFVKTKSKEETKLLLEVLKKMQFSVSIADKETLTKATKKYNYTDEEMALPGINPSTEDFENWLTKPDKDKGASAEVVRKRLLSRINKATSTK